MGLTCTPPTPSQAPPLTDEVDPRIECPPGRDQIVNQQHPLPRLDGVGVHLDLVRAVLGYVLLADLGT